MNASNVENNLYRDKEVMKREEKRRHSGRGKGTLVRQAATKRKTVDAQESEMPACRHIRIDTQALINTQEYPH